MGALALFSATLDVEANTPPSVVQPYIAIAEAFVRGGQYRTTNYGSGNVMLKNGQGSYMRRGLFKFPAIARPHQGVAQTVYFSATGTSKYGGSTRDTLTLRTMGNSWNESTVTLRNRPGPGAVLGSTRVGLNRPTLINLTSHFNNRSPSTSSFEIRSSLVKRIHYLRAHDASAPVAQKPQLRVTRRYLDRSAEQGRTLAISLSDQVFYDADGDAVTLDVAGLPVGLAFSPANNTITGTLGPADVGTHTITVSGSDPSGASASDAFTLTVSGSTDAPRYAHPPSPPGADEDLPFAFTMAADTFTDSSPEDSLELTAVALPDWLAFDPTTATLSGTPGNEHVGSNRVTIRATDTTGRSALGNFELTVINSNDAPVVEQGMSDLYLDEEQSLSLRIPSNAFRDVDAGDSLRYFATDLPSWLQFDASSNTLSGRPDGRHLGTHRVAIRAEDNAGETAELYFEITVGDLAQRDRVRDIVETARTVQAGEARLARFADLLASLPTLPTLTSRQKKRFAARVARAKPDPHSDADLIALANQLLEDISAHPTLDLQLEQDGRQVQRLRADGGPSALIVRVTNPLFGQPAAFDWSRSHAALLTQVEVLDDNRARLVIAPGQLPAGDIFTAVARVSRAGRTAVAKLRIPVAPTATAESQTRDSDGDGIVDHHEGSLRADLDPTASHRLQSRRDDDQHFLLTTEPGLKLQLGQSARAAAVNQSTLSLGAVTEHLPDASAEHVIDALPGQALGGVATAEYMAFDFEVVGLASAGESVQVVLPLPAPIEPEARYLKFHAATGWQAFTTDALNQIHSAPWLDSTEGLCPPTGHQSYQEGLSPGHTCVQLTLQDGGPNDADRYSADDQLSADEGLNGIVVDPGAIVVPKPAVQDSFRVTTGLGGLGAEIGCLALATLAGRRRRKAATASTGTHP